MHFYKFQRVHIFMTHRKVRNTAQLTKMADGIYAELRIFNRLVQKEKKIPGFYIYPGRNLRFDYFSELKIMLR